MSKTLISIIIILIATGVICSLAVKPINKGIGIYYSNNHNRFNEIFEDKTHHDIIFIGSSRTIFHVYPKIIDSICGVSSYNAGVTGGKIADFEMILKGYLFNHPAPKVVVLNLDLMSFSKLREIRRHNEYYPFLDNKAVVSTLAKYGYSSNIIKYLPFLSIADLDDYNKENALRLSLTGKGDTSIPHVDLEYKGFLSVFKTMTPDTTKFRGRYDVFEASLASLNEIIGTCQKNKIKLIFTYAPEYNFSFQKVTTNSDSIIGVINQIAKLNGIIYLRHDSLPLCRDSSLFWNFNHLNERGAMIYSNILGSELKEIIATNH